MNQIYDDAAERVVDRVVELGLPVDYLLVDLSSTSAAYIDVLTTVGPTIIAVIHRAAKLEQLMDLKDVLFERERHAQGTMCAKVPLAICVSY